MIAIDFPMFLSTLFVKYKCFVVKMIPASSSSRDGDVTVYVKDIDQPSSLTPHYSVLVSASLFMALSTVFHLIDSPENSPLSRCVLPVFFSALLALSTTYLCMKVFFSPDKILCGWLGLKHRLAYLQVRLQ